MPAGERTSPRRRSSRREKKSLDALSVVKDRSEFLPDVLIDRGPFVVVHLHVAREKDNGRERAEVP